MPTNYKSKRLADILDEDTSEDIDYICRVLPKLKNLHSKIEKSRPMKTEDLGFVVDLILDLEENPHHRASKLELTHCNELWKTYAK
jgi:hemerythrin-like domain-containing protein